MTQQAVEKTKGKGREAISLTSEQTEMLIWMLMDERYEAEQWLKKHKVLTLKGKINRVHKYMTEDERLQLSQLSEILELQSMLSKLFCSL